VESSCLILLTAAGLWVGVCGAFSGLLNGVKGALWPSLWGVEGEDVLRDKRDILLRRLFKARLWRIGSEASRERGGTGEGLSEADGEEDVTPRRSSSSGRESQ